MIFGSVGVAEEVQPWGVRGWDAGDLSEANFWELVGRAAGR